PMGAAQRLRFRILMALGSGGFVAASACGGKVVVDQNASAGEGGGPASSSASASASASASVGAGAATGTTTASTGAGGSGATPSCTDGPPTQECFPNCIGCPCAEAPQVQNSCCNPAIAGPIGEEDQCCYWFCEGACCGRPFVVEGTARVARVTERSDWGAAGA